MNVLLKSVKIIDPANQSHHLKKRDIFIKNGVIERIASRIEPKPNVRVIQLKNLHVSRGWFDSSVSFGEPGYEERETIANGLATAAKSGFTSVVLNPNTHPKPDSSGDIIFLKNAAASSAVSLFPLGTLTVKGGGTDLAELYDMHSAGAVGFYDYKAPLGNSNLLKIALQYARNFGGLVYSFPMDVELSHKGNVHEGEHSVRLGLKGIPNLAEDLQVGRDLSLLEYSDGKLHIPLLSSAGAVKHIAEAKRKGLDVSCSVALHNLWFTDEVLETFDSNYKVLPPLRAKNDQKALLKGLRDGVIDFVTTDHTPMDIEQKRLEFDNAGFGSLGLEGAFGILNQLFDNETAVALLTRGKERYGIPDIPISPGEAACLTLFDPEITYTLEEDDLYSTSKNSMYLGEELKGKAHGIIANNQLVLNT